MAKGHYKKEYGGSKSGYEKGAKDTLKKVGVILIVILFIVTIILLK